MSGLLNCGICCMCLSLWGIVQLSLMGVFYYIESVALLEDCEEEEYEDYDDFIVKTKHNFRATAINCWIAAGIYFVSLIISFMCVKKANKKAMIEAKHLEDDEYTCTPRPEKKSNKKIT